MLTIPRCILVAAEVLLWSVIVVALFIVFPYERGKGLCLHTLEYMTEKEALTAAETQYFDYFVTGRFFGEDFGKNSSEFTDSFKQSFSADNLHRLFDEHVDIIEMLGGTFPSIREIIWIRGDYRYFLNSYMRAVYGYYGTVDFIVPEKKPKAILNLEGDTELNKLIYLIENWGGERYYAVHNCVKTGASPQSGSMDSGYWGTRFKGW
jgi:hypothetical protein